ncbi:hypothetical protein [Brevibacterium litoralis]|uniref:hypothetical protein n=1 Tax=Brevibacterium litoralis TaxID=3138935 RepID=UPI0032EB6F3E
MTPTPEAPGPELQHNQNTGAGAAPEAPGPELQHNQNTGAGAAPEAPGPDLRRNRTAGAGAAPEAPRTPETPLTHRPARWLAAAVAPA